MIFRFGGLCFFIGLFLSACSPRLIKDLKASSNEKHHHTGFMLYDPEKKLTLAELNSDKYFTPASNAKILTFYAGLQLLEDSLPAFKYFFRGDSMIIWGTGDPSFLNRHVHQNEKVYEFLKNYPGPVFFSFSNFDEKHFGPGWAWDDYQEYYSAERSAFPLYGNVMVINKEEDQIQTAPRYFQNDLVRKDTITESSGITRETTSNQLHHQDGVSQKKIELEIPFKVSDELILQLLSDTLKRKVERIDLQPYENSKTLKSIPADSLYKVMMQQSDNFMAEQILLMCSSWLGDTLNIKRTIAHVTKELLFDLPDVPVWVDGSGLSRYNQVTPRSIVRLWEKIYALVPQERLFSLLAVGGKTGTLRGSFKGEKPYIFGKTGSLSNNYCLSGYLVTKKGRVLIFSSMNANFTVPVRQVRENLEKILLKVYEKY